MSQIWYAAAGLAPLPPLPFDLDDLDGYGLRDYQRRIINEVVLRWLEGYRRILIQLPTGGGKTVIATALHGSAAVLDHPSQFLVHRKELIDQTSATLRRAGIEHGLVASGEVMSFDAMVIVAGIQTLVNRLDLVRRPRVVLVDECFAAGTLVDGKAIETLKVGDYVTAFDEHSGTFSAKQITSVFRNHYHGDMMRIDVVGHHAIHSTKAHPFWTKRGWIEAKDLKAGDYVLTRKHQMYNVYCDCGHEITGSSEKISHNGSGLLLPRMCKNFHDKEFIRDNESYKSQARFGENDCSQPYETRSLSSEDVSIFACDQSSAQGSRWQRETSNRSGNASVSNVFRSGFCEPVHSCDKGQGLGLPQSLQDRLRQCRVEDRHRSRRTFSPESGSQGAGSEERCVSSWARVDGVQILEPDDLGAATGGLFDGYVYNIEVEDFHTYLANDIVVHNCHHATSNTYERVLSSYPPDTLILGLTASPQRLDGRGLDEQFDIMVLGPTPAELIAAGHLCEYEFYGPDAPDLTGVGDVAGEFSRSGSQAVMERPSIIGNIVGHYLELARGKQGIGFAVSREHSRKMVDAFRASGFRAAHLDGDTPKDERRAMDAAFRRGELDWLWNVDLFGEGYDVPGAVYLADAAPTKSLVKVLQRWGRVLRPAPGKAVGIIADHAGNHTRHGLPDSPREWTLAGREKKARGSPTDAVGVRTCLICYRVSESGTEVCPGCGTEFPKQDRQIEEREGKLTKIEREALARKTAAMRKAEEKACKSEGELIALAQARGYQNPVGWARMRVKFRNNWRQ